MKNTIFGVIACVGFILLLGTAGAIDAGILDIGIRSVLQIILGLTGFSVGMYLVAKNNAMYGRKHKDERLL